MIYTTSSANNSFVNASPSQYLLPSASPSYGSNGNASTISKKSFSTGIIIVEDFDQ